MGHPFDGVRQRVRKIVHGINAPRVARAMMRRMRDTVKDGVAHGDIRRRHVDFCSQHMRSVGKLALFHTLEKRQIFFDAARAIRAFLPRLGERSPVGADLLRRKIADKRFTAFN